MLNCKPGFHPFGESRTNCKWHKKSKSMVWTHELGSCITCDENSLIFTDHNISPFCYIADGTNEKACELR